MKKLFLLTLLCMLGLTFVACEKKEEENIITEEDIEQDEEFQKILLQTSMVRSDTMTMEERVDYMLTLYRNTFEESESLLQSPNSMYHYCSMAAHIAFIDVSDLSYSQREKISSMLKEPILKAYNDWDKKSWETYPGIDWDTLIPELRANAFEILGIKGE